MTPKKHYSIINRQLKHSVLMLVKRKVHVVIKSEDLKVKKVILNCKDNSLNKQIKFYREKNIII